MAFFPHAQRWRALAVLVAWLLLLPQSGALPTETGRAELGRQICLDCTIAVRQEFCEAFGSSKVASLVSPASRIFPIDFEYVDRVEGMESRCRVPGELFQSRNLSRFEICEGESSFLRSILPVRD
jgi:hypothetical protein